jgi:hypothetical protein
MDSESNKKQNEDGHPWTPALIGFYDFVEASREFLKMPSCQDDNLDLTLKLEEMMEITKENSAGTQYQESKFDSAIYRDINRIALLRKFLQKFPFDNLKRFQKIIELELQGLEGDLKPRAVLTSTLPAAIIVGLGLAAAWSTLWANYFSFDIAKIFIEVLSNKLQQIKWLNWVASLTFVFGGFVGIGWYVTVSYQNLKQISHLRSLHRAITLYLSLEKFDIDT